MKPPISTDDDKNVEELNRYIEYLQRQLVNPETEFLVNKEQQWFAENRERIKMQLREVAEEFPASEGFKRLEQSLVEFTPSSPYDSFHAREIFLPYLKRVSEYMREAGISLKSDVIFANAPATNRTHLPGLALMGTFCSPEEVFMRFVTIGQRSIQTLCSAWGRLKKSDALMSQDVEEVLESSPVGKLLLRLTIYYAITGSLIGFGKVEEPKQNRSARAALLAAMELFIVAHELHHFGAEAILP